MVDLNLVRGPSTRALQFCSARGLSFLWFFFPWDASFRATSSFRSPHFFLWGPLSFLLATPDFQPARLPETFRTCRTSRYLPPPSLDETPRHELEVASPLHPPQAAFHLSRSKTPRQHWMPIRAIFPPCHVKWVDVAVSSPTSTWNPTAPSFKKVIIISYESKYQNPMILIHTSRRSQSPPPTLQGSRFSARLREEDVTSPTTAKIKLDLDLSMLHDGQHSLFKKIKSVHCKKVKCKLEFNADFSFCSKRICIFSHNSQFPSMII